MNIKTDLNMILDRVLVELDYEETTIESGIITTNRTERDAIKQAKVLSIGPGKYVTHCDLKVGDIVLIDQYESVVTPDPNNKALRIVEDHEIIAVLEGKTNEH